MKLKADRLEGVAAARVSDGGTQQILQAVIERIESGQYPPGSQVPTYHQWEQEFGVKHGTASRAMLVLRAARVIESRSTKGNFVRTDVLEP